jgi:hypothetical protein
MELICELALAGKAISRAQTALPDQLAELQDDLLR